MSDAGEKRSQTARMKKLRLANLDDIMERSKLLAEHVLASHPDSEIWYEARDLLSRIETHEVIHDYPTT